MNGERHPIVDPFAERVCVGCGCTELTPCVENGIACHWVDGVLDDGDCCSVCVALARALQTFEEGERTEPEIEICSPVEGQRFIEKTRPKRISRAANG